MNIELQHLGGLGFGASFEWPAGVCPKDQYANNFFVPVKMFLGEVTIRLITSDVPEDSHEVATEDHIDRQEWHMEPLVMGGTSAEFVSVCRRRS